MTALTVPVTVVITGIVPFPVFPAAMPQTETRRAAGAAWAPRADGPGGRRRALVFL